MHKFIKNIFLLMCVRDEKLFQRGFLFLGGAAALSKCMDETLTSGKFSLRLHGGGYFTAARWSYDVLAAVARRCLELGRIVRKRRVQLGVVVPVMLLVCCHLPLAYDAVPVCARAR